MTWVFNQEPWLSSGFHCLASPVQGLGLREARGRGERGWRSCRARMAAARSFRRKDGRPDAFLEWRCLDARTCGSPRRLGREGNVRAAVCVCSDFVKSHGNNHRTKPTTNHPYPEALQFRIGKSYDVHTQPTRTAELPASIFPGIASKGGSSTPWKGHDRRAGAEASHSFPPCFNVYLGIAG